MTRPRRAPLAKYDAALAEQGGRCAICGKSAGKRDKRLHQDHCHATGLLRGLLCGRCNVGLGMFRDSRENLLNAAAYLARHQAPVAPVVSPLPDRLRAAMAMAEGYSQASAYPSEPARVE